MCILKGFPTTLAASHHVARLSYPFGMWFANDHTLYVADEGAGDNTYDSTTNTYINSTASAQPEAGLEKWVFDATTQQWNLAYTLQNGLDLGRAVHGARLPDRHQPRDRTARGRPPPTACAR